MRFAFPFRSRAGRRRCAAAALAGCFAPLVGCAVARADRARRPACGARRPAPGLRRSRHGRRMRSDASKPPRWRPASPMRNSPASPRKALDKVRQVARSAERHLPSRAVLSSPTARADTTGSLPHVAAKLAAGRPVVIIAFGSSSTEGYGSSAPEFTYPNRLAGAVAPAISSADITVLNRGKGGEDAPEMMKRLQTRSDRRASRHGDLAGRHQCGAAQSRSGRDREAGRGRRGAHPAPSADVVLVDPQYSPRVTERPESARGMVKLLGRIAALRHVGIFPRFEVMRDWHEKQAIPINDFVIADGLHMNDWG